MLKRPIGSVVLHHCSFLPEYVLLFVIECVISLMERFASIRWWSVVFSKLYSNIWNLLELWSLLVLGFRLLPLLYSTIYNRCSIRGVRMSHPEEPCRHSVLLILTQNYRSAALWNRSYCFAMISRIEFFGEVLELLWYARRCFAALFLAVDVSLWVGNHHLGAEALPGSGTCTIHNFHSWCVCDVLLSGLINLFQRSLASFRHQSW